MRARSVIAGFALCAAGVLAWGWWHARTHATLDVSVRDLAGKTERQAWASVTSADIEFLDGGGKVVARGQIGGAYNVFGLLHPELGDCSRHAVESTQRVEAREEWRRCFAAVSEWVPTWVDGVRQVTVTLPDCRIPPIAARPTRMADDWWLWWVPLPHIGGVPYGYYSLTLDVDSRKCQAAP